MPGIGSPIITIELPILTSAWAMPPSGRAMRRRSLALKAFRRNSIKLAAPGTTR